VFAEPAEDEITFEGEVLRSTIAFESVRGGALRLVTPTRVAAEIAANMLGIDPSDPEAESQGRAAVSEILNVIGGAFITRYFGTQVPSQLGLPVTDLVATPLPVARRTCAAAMRLESGEPVLLELDLEEGPAA